MPINFNYFGLRNLAIFRNSLRFSIAVKGDKHPKDNYHLVYI